MKRLVPIASATSRDEHGGKGEHLGFLAGLAMRVPPGAVVPASAFVEHVAACKGGGDLAAAVLARAVDPELASELVAVARELGGRVSVRSSATLEDAKTHSFAGQFLTVLDVGPEGVVDAVRRVWASAFTDNVKAYLARAGLDAKKLAMAVVVQHQLDSRASGVAMGDRRRAMVEAVLGQGEALVSGEAAADQWEVKDGKIVSRTIADKRTRRVLAAGPTGASVREDVPEDECKKPALTDAQVLEAADCCARIAEACGGRAQDCEFAYAGGELHLLQTRDVTASLPVSAPPLGPFAAPGKGAWALDASHFRRPTTRLFQEIFPAGMMAGFKRSTERYGALLSHADVAFVNGFAYLRMRPVMAPEDATAKPPPPKIVFKILLALAPPLRRRVKTAERIWQTREWRAQLEEWKAAKARAIAEHVRIQSVDMKKLDDAALAEHFRVAYAHARAMVEQHHTYNLAVMVPGGDLLAHVERWSAGRVTAGDALALVAGSAPISADLRTKEALAMGAGLAADSEARRLLALDDTSDRAPDDATAAEALTALAARPGATGAAVREFLAHREYRLVEGLDPGAPATREVPGLLWRALRVTATSGANAHVDAIDPVALARVRGAVPAEHHAELDGLIEEARLVASLRDERALYSDVWAWGILRTVVLAIGERLLARPLEPGAPAPLVMASDLVHASSSEIESLLLRKQGPSATELEARAAFARAYTTNDAPAHLGPPELPPPSAALLPRGAARLTTAVMTLLPHIIAAPKEQSGSSALVGLPASGGVHEGTAHVVDSHDDVDGIEPGAVLVVGAGSSSFTMMAPLASAVVAEGGGLLSHVAIVCREYRIPCVVGCSGVLTAVKSGQRVRVDGTRGVVELLDAEPALATKRTPEAAKPREHTQRSDAPPAS